MGILSKLKELYNRNKYKQDKRNEVCRLKHEKNVNKAIKHFLKEAESSAKGGYKAYSECLFDFYYSDIVLVDARIILKDEYSLELDYDSRTLTLRGWA